MRPPTVHKRIGKWVARAATAGMVATGLVQELWSPRSDDPAAAVAAWAGPWALAPAPVLALYGLRTGDRFVSAGSLTAGALVARRVGGTAQPGPADVTVYVHNVLAVNRHIRRLAEGIAAVDPDLALLVELHERHVPALENALPGHHSALQPSRGFGGVGVVSRHPIESTDVFVAGSLRALAVRTDGITAVVVHLPSPRLRWPLQPDVSEQAEAVASLAAKITNLEGPLMVGGDFNATRWNRSHRTLVDAGGLTDAVRAVTRDWALTYPATSPLVRIDHLLVRGLMPRWARRLPPAGSDHHPLLVGLHRDAAA